MSTETATKKHSATYRFWAVVIRIAITLFIMHELYAWAGGAGEFQPAGASTVVYCSQEIMPTGGCIKGAPPALKTAIVTKCPAGFVFIGEKRPNGSMICETPAKWAAYKAKLTAAAKAYHAEHPCSTQASCQPPTIDPK